MMMPVMMTVVVVMVFVVIPMVAMFDPKPVPFIDSKLD